MLVITGWYCKLVGWGIILLAAAVLLARMFIIPTHQIAFVGSTEARAGVYFMDVNRGIFTHPIRTPIIGRQSDFTWSPDFKTIVFRAVQNITIDLYATNLTGDQQRQLTGTGKNNHNPAFSPDGHWLAFTSERDGNSEIYVMSTACLDAETRCLDAETHRLTNNRFVDEQASWSPDSRQIVFQSNRDGNAQIYTMKADGSDQRRLTNSPRSDLAPSWSPDGQLIAFMSDRDINDEIYVMNTDGSNLVRLTNTPEYEFTPQWSPDGKQILFQRTVRGSEFETYVMDSNGSHVQRLTTVSMFLQNPVWRS